ncbi:MAG TPA: hypothetical protein VMH86_01390 [Rhizomicrobium sp.]|nr:hypothetical protein [Rhizomicrobium sp.]
MSARTFEQRPRIAGAAPASGFHPHGRALSGGTRLLSGDGRTGSEGAGDFFRPIDVFFSNIGAGIAGLFGVDIKAEDTNGPAWDPHGEFRWDVNFSTDGKNGWLVQKNELSYRVQDARGADLPFSYPPVYFEAWPVDANSRVLPHPGDTWARPNMDKLLKTQTQGHWSTRSRVYFTRSDPAKQGFRPGAVKEAGGHLLSSTSEPKDLGIPKLHRYAQGLWDLSGKHEGTKG